MCDRFRVHSLALRQTEEKHQQTNDTQPCSYVQRDEQRQCFFFVPPVALSRPAGVTL